MDSDLPDREGGAATEAIERASSQLVQGRQYVWWAGAELCGKGEIDETAKVGVYLFQVNPWMLSQAGWLPG